MTEYHKQDVRRFLADYRAEHPEDLITIDQPVLDDQDATALIWNLADRGQHPMLHLKNVSGIGSEVLCNIFASRDRIGRLLGSTADRLHEAYQARANRPFTPQILEEGPITAEIISSDAVDLNALPMLKHFDTDRAKYITSGIIIGEHPETGAGNLSYHRAMIHSKNSLATSLHSRGHLWRLMNMAKEKGKPMPVAMVIGGHPLFMIAASARLAFGEDERDVAGGLMGEPLQVVRTPKYGIRVPAHAEIVLEGVLDPEAHVEEGPFGEFTGYSSDRSTNNLFTVETMMRRRDAMLVSVAGGQFRRAPKPWPCAARGGGGGEAEGPLPLDHRGTLPLVGHAFPRLYRHEPDTRGRGAAGHARPSRLGPVPENRRGGGRGCRYHPRRRGTLGARHPFPAAQGRRHHRGPAGQRSRSLGQRHRYNLTDGARCDARPEFPRRARPHKR